MYIVPERGLQFDFQLTVVDGREYVHETLGDAANKTRLSAHGDFRALEIPGIAPDPGFSPVGVRPVEAGCRGRSPRQHRPRAQRHSGITGMLVACRP